MLKKFIINVGSNWANMLITIIIAFIVSPILVKQLGHESYGVWVLIVSITGYFTVLDFGINTALVRYISKYVSAKKYHYANQIYNTSFVFFILIGILVILASLIISLFFKDFFSIKNYSQEYLFYVFAIIGIDLAINIIFSIYLGALTGLQRFLEINLIIISTNIIKNSLLVVFLLNDYNLLTIAILQLNTSFLKYALQYLLIKKNYSFLHFSPKQTSKASFKQIVNYSLYIFIIAIATKILFFTDTIVIGRILDVSQITFYAIPAMIAEYLDKLIWAITIVLIPIISSKDQHKDIKTNQSIYQLGTKYTILLFSPILLVLLTQGGAFLTLWMGKEIATQATPILIILMIGYIFYLSQMIAYGILTGLSKHKVLAFIMAAEAISNLTLSIYLAPIYGIKGVAYGTIIPMLIANLIAIPLYTSHILKIHYSRYILRTLIPPLISFLLFYSLLKMLSISINNYVQLSLYSLGIVICYGLYAFHFHLEKQHKKASTTIMKRSLAKLCRIN